MTARGPVRWFLGAFALGIVIAVSLATCAGGCMAAPLSTEAGLRAALARFP